MKIKELYIKGFGLIEKAHTIIPDTLNLIYGTNNDSKAMDNNASGKTTILHAIVWCLFGRTPKGSTKNKLINSKSEEAIVRLTFDDLTIERRKHIKTSEKLTINGESVGNPQDQKNLESLLNINYDLFISSYYIGPGSNTTAFIHATDGERLKLIEHIFSGEVFRKAQPIAGKKMQEISYNISEHNNRMTVINSEIEKFKQRLQNAYTSKREIQAAKAGRLTTLNESLNNAQKEYDKQTEILMNQITNEQVYNNSYNNLTKQITQLQAQLYKIHENIAECPYCYQMIEPSHIQKLEKVNQRINQELEPLIIKYNKELDELNRIKSNINNQRNNVSSLTFQITTLKNQISQEEAQEKSESIIDHQIALITSDIESLSLELKTRTQDVQALSEELKLHTFWYEGFSSSGIRTMLLDTVRNYLTHYTKYWSNLISGGDFVIDFPQSDSGFPIRVISMGQEYDFSTAEGWRINFAVMLAMNSILRAMQTTPLDFLLLDDILEGSLDDTGVHHFMNTISNILPSRFGQNFVTLPKRFDNISGNVIMVERSLNSSLIRSKS